MDLIANKNDRENKHFFVYLFNEKRKVQVNYFIVFTNLKRAVSYT